MSGRQTNTALANTLRAETNKVNSDNGWQGHMADGSDRVDGRWQLQSGWKGHMADGSDRADGRDRVDSRDVWWMTVSQWTTADDSH